MANTFKLKTKADVGITTTNVYVVPSATTSTVLGIAIAMPVGIIAVLPELIVILFLICATRSIPEDPEVL